MSLRAARDVRQAAKSGGLSLAFANRYFQSQRQSSRLGGLSDISGMRGINDKTELSAALRRFRELYGDGEIKALRAPARINILGEHVDYVSYLPTASLPFGSHEHEMLMLFRESSSIGGAGEDRVRGASMLEKFPLFEFQLNEETIWDQTRRSWETIVFNRPAPAPHWSNYVKGAVSFARWKYGVSVKRGFDFLIESSVPPQSGASSSSALVTLAGAAIRLANGIEYDLAELARDSSQAEWFMGTRGGALDHTTICLARRGCAVKISHSDGQTELIPLPDKGFRWVTFFSHEADKGRGVMLEYNERAAVSRLLIPAMLASAMPVQDAIEALPESVTLDDVSRLYPQVFEECARAFPSLVSERRGPLKLLDRARHHAGEVERVAKAVGILTDISHRPDAAIRELGHLLSESHASLRDLYEVSTPEVERLIEILAADPQVYGARLMGGGFGGNVLALTTDENARPLINRVQNEYYEPRGRDGAGEGSVMISTPGDGLRSLEL
jgi:galactokinase